jgi:regulator of cell morphogenesis and NO signaling
MNLPITAVPTTTDKLTATIGQLVTERPLRAKIFESFGIDYCCGGKKPLAQACAELNLDPKTVIGILDAFDAQGADRAGNERDWSKASLAELADHIEHTHHAYLKEELPRLDFIVHKVANRHGDHDPRLAELARTFAKFRADMELHMGKEEHVLFPMCRRLATATALPASHPGRIDNPIAVMIAEHDDAGHDLRRMHDLTDGYTPPPTACNSYRAMLEGLAHLERDTHRHVHKENSVLFPAAIDAERRLRAPHDHDPSI